MIRHASLPLLTLCAVALVLSGCGGSGASAARPTATPTIVPTSPPGTIAEVITSTALPVPTATSAATPTPGTTATTPPPTATSPPAAVAPQVSAASVTPASVAGGTTIHARVQVRGRAGRVDVYLSSGPGGAAPVTIALAALGAGAWAGTATAPATAGTYHFTVGLFDLSGHRTIADSDAWNISVTGTSLSSGPQALPADIPLVPPFSYGSPQTAVFSAEGRTVSGSEVVSNSRPDITAGAVAQWYEVHFPRAGWTVDQSTIPGPGATSLSIVATIGTNRVCVVSYSGGTVQIFYGLFSS